jgi:hypothetical protein
MTTPEKLQSQLDAKSGELRNYLLSINDGWDETELEEMCVKTLTAYLQCQRESKESGADVRIGDEELHRIASEWHKLTEQLEYMERQ